MNATCGSFWFWFMRPFAETLGVISFLLVIAAVGLFVLWVRKWLK